MNIGARLFFIIQFLLTAFLCYPQKDSKYEKDFRILREALEATHPSLYRFTPKEKFDFVFDSLKKSISDSTDQWSFFRKTSIIESLIMEGHSSIMMSSEMQDELSDQKVFPLEVEFMEDGLLIKSSNDSSNQYLVGEVIHSINGQSKDKILSIIRSSSGSRSGDSDGFLTGTLSYKNNFALAYALFVSSSSTYQIQLSDGQLIELNASQAKSIKYRQLWDENDQPLTISYDNQRQTAYLKISTFAHWVIGKDAKYYLNFFTKAFSEIDKRGIEYLIIDVRNNRGGDEMIAAKLISYFYEEPFRINKSIRVQLLDFSKLDSLTTEKLPSFKAKQYQKTDSGYSKLEDKRLEYVAPIKKHHFEGKVFVLSNGICFSATSIFLSHVKSLGAATIVGEESGGTYGVVDGHWMMNFKLPHSQFNVRYPLWGHEVDVKKGNLRRGVIPDHIIPKTEKDVFGQTDSQLEFVYSLIKNAN